MNGIIALLVAALFIGVVTLVVARLSDFFGRFNEETRRIAGKIRRAQDSDEYIYWQNELRRHYICLIPFVSEKTAGQIYIRLFRKQKHYAEKRTGEEPKVGFFHNGAEEHRDGLFHILAPSVLSICLCAVCLCGISWAWFTATGSADVSSIRAASCTVDVTVVGAEQYTKSATDGVTTITFNAAGTYIVTIKPGADNTATAGYCEINFDSTGYCTGDFISDSISLTVYALEDNVLKIAPKWGEYSGTANDISDGNILGTPPNENDDADADSSTETDGGEAADNTDAENSTAAAATDDVTTTEETAGNNTGSGDSGETSGNENAAGETETAESESTSDSSKASSETTSAEAVTNSSAETTGAAETVESTGFDE